MNVSMTVLKWKYANLCEELFSTELQIINNKFVCANNAKIRKGQVFVIYIYNNNNNPCDDIN